MSHVNLSSSYTRRVYNSEETKIQYTEYGIISDTVLMNTFIRINQQKKKNKNSNITHTNRQYTKSTARHCLIAKF